MAKNKKQIKSQIAKIEGKLKATYQVFERDRGPTRDALRIVIPMLQDQLKVLDDIVELIEEK